LGGQAIQGKDVHLTVVSGDQVACPVCISAAPNAHDLDWL
jgi:hypothetical protein